jgi:CheY-like chemotaxis protein
MTTILYIEDNEDNIFVFMRRLSKKGYDVIIAHDGEAGISMARSERPSLILMDLDLPVVDGWEATRLLKASPETSHIPVIAVSAYAMVEDQRRALDAGCDDIISKPVDMKALCARIETLRFDGVGK